MLIFPRRTCHSDAHCPPAQSRDAGAGARIVERRVAMSLEARFLPALSEERRQVEETIWAETQRATMFLSLGNVHDAALCVTIAIKLMPHVDPGWFYDKELIDLLPCLVDLVYLDEKYYTDYDMAYGQYELTEFDRRRAACIMTGWGDPGHVGTFINGQNNKTAEQLTFMMNPPF